MELNYLKTFIDKEELVLFEEKSKEKKDWYEGYTDHYIRVAVQYNDSLIGKIVPVCLETIQDGIMLENNLLANLKEDFGRWCRIYS